VWTSDAAGSAELGNVSLDTSPCGDILSSHPTVWQCNVASAKTNAAATQRKQASQANRRTQAATPAPAVHKLEQISDSSTEVLLDRPPAALAARMPNTARGSGSPMLSDQGSSPAVSPMAAEFPLDASSCYAADAPGTEPTPLSTRFGAEPSEEEVVFELLDRTSSYGGELALEALPHEAVAHHAQFDSAMATSLAMAQAAAAGVQRAACVWPPDATTGDQAESYGELDVGAAHVDVLSVAVLAGRGCEPGMCVAALLVRAQALECEAQGDRDGAGGERSAVLSTATHHVIWVQFAAADGGHAGTRVLHVHDARRSDAHYVRSRFVWLLCHGLLCCYTA
jgi:hypothetical protein